MLEKFVDDGGETVYINSSAVTLARRKPSGSVNIMLVLWLVDGSTVELSNKEAERFLKLAVVEDSPEQPQP